MRPEADLTPEAIAMLREAEAKGRATLAAVRAERASPSPAVARFAVQCGGPEREVAKRRQNGHYVPPDEIAKILGDFRAPEGGWTCPDCGDATLGPARCSTCYEAHETENRRRSLSDALATLETRIPRKYRWARLDAPELPKRVPIVGRFGLEPQKLRQLLTYEVVTIFGSSAAGKTSLAIALLRALFDGAEHALATTERARKATFVHARELPDLEGAAWDLACGGPAVVIDDIGSESGERGSFSDSDRARAMANALEMRHCARASGRITICTTYLPETEWKQRYGDGIGRRYFDKGDATVRVMDLDKQTR